MFRRLSSTRRRRNPLIPVTPEDYSKLWSEIDLTEFCGGFECEISSSGDLEIQVQKGSSPVIISSPDRKVDYIIGTLKGELPGVNSIYSESEGAALLKLPENELRQKVWSDYVERSHKPWLEHVQRLVSGGGMPTGVTVSPGL